jgi:hypothetical protein
VCERCGLLVVSLLIADAMSWFQFTVAVVAASSDSNDMIS